MHPVVFIHGIRVSRTMWNPQLRLLHGKTLAIAVDLPGHGHRRTEPFTMATAVASIADAIDAIGEPVVLVGASLGGYVAYATAAAHPDHTTGVVTIGSTAIITPTRIRPYRLLGKTGFGEKLQRAVIRARLERSAAADLTAGGMSIEAVPDILNALAEFDALTAVAAYSGPTRFVNGRWDRFRIDEKRFLSTAPDGQLTIVGGAGHLVNLTRPGEVTAVVEAAATIRH